MQLPFLCFNNQHKGVQMANRLTYEELEQRVKALQKELAEREKELNCLYGLSRIVEEHETSLNEILQEVPSLLLSHLSK